MVSKFTFLTLYTLLYKPAIMKCTRLIQIKYPTQKLGKILLSLAFVKMVGTNDLTSLQIQAAINDGSVTDSINLQQKLKVINDTNSIKISLFPDNKALKMKSICLENEDKAVKTQRVDQVDDSVNDIFKQLENSKNYKQSTQIITEEKLQHDNSEKNVSSNPEKNITKGQKNFAKGIVMNKHEINISGPKNILRRILNLIKNDFNESNFNVIDQEKMEPRFKALHEFKKHWEIFITNQPKDQDVKEQNDLYEDLVKNYRKIYNQTLEITPSDLKNIFLTLLNDISVEYGKEYKPYYKQQVDNLVLKIFDRIINEKLTIENILDLHQVLVSFYLLKIIKLYNNDSYEYNAILSHIYMMEHELVLNNQRIEPSYQKKPLDNKNTTIANSISNFPGSSYIKELKESEFLKIAKDVKKRLNKNLISKKYQIQTINIKDKIGEIKKKLKKIIEEKSGLKEISYLKESDLVQNIKYYEELMMDEEMKEIEKKNSDKYDIEKIVERRLYKKMIGWYRENIRNDLNDASLSNQYNQKVTDQAMLLNKMEYIKKILEQFREDNKVFVSQNEYIVKLAEMIIHDEKYTHEILNLESEIEKFLKFESYGENKTKIIRENTFDLK